MQEPDDKLSRIREFYDSNYWRSASIYAGLPRHLERLASRLDVSSGETVLDVACGVGQWLWACDRRGALPYGVDLSEKAIDVCRSVMPHGKFHVQAAESLPFEDDSFDLVSCLGSLEHFVDPASALREMRRVAKPDARVLLLVPNSDFLTRRLGLYGGTNQVVAREEVRPLGEWSRLFEACGLHVEERWRDLHVFSWHWIRARGPLGVPLRAAQALALAAWPLKWQYQVYHLCTV